MSAKMASIPQKLILSDVIGPKPYHRTGTACTCEAGDGRASQNHYLTRLDHL